MSEEFCLFWGGCFSQWYKADMTIDNVEYNCCEQFMMSEKAKLFYDEDSRAFIMMSKNPREQKAIGRRVKNFNADNWNKVCRDVVYKANYAKFTQNSDCLLELYKSRGKTIVEASPYDTIWGIGLSADDPKAQDRTQWRGTNWLGEAIMKVRDELDRLGVFKVFEGGEEGLKERMEEYAIDYAIVARASSVGKSK